MPFSSCCCQFALLPPPSRLGKSQWLYLCLDGGRRGVQGCSGQEAPLGTGRSPGPQGGAACSCIPLGCDTLPLEVAAS